MAAFFSLFILSLMCSVTDHTVCTFTEKPHAFSLGERRRRIRALPWHWDLSLLRCSPCQLLFQIFCPSIIAPLLKQSSIKMVVLGLARAHSSGGGICRRVMQLKHFDFTYNAFPWVSLARLYSFPAFIFPNGMCNLQLGPTIIATHTHHVPGCTANNTTSTGKLQVSKDISRKRNFLLLFCPLKRSSPELLRVGWQSTGAASQECCQLCSSALCQKQIRKPAVSSVAQSCRGELKGLCKAEINFWQRMSDVHELLKLLDIKSTGLFYYRWAQLAGFLCRGNWNAAAFWTHESVL